MVNQQLGTNTFTTAKWIVSATASNGTHTTIASALTSASSGDTIFIRQGTYTENITLKAGVNLAAYECDAFNNVIILGTCTLSVAGTVSISGIQLQTNSAFALAITGSAASVVNLKDCFINCTNNTGISFTVTNTSARLNCYDCEADAATTGIAYIADSSTGVTSFISCAFGNSGASTTSNTKSAGTLNIFNCFMGLPYTFSSNAVAGIFNTDFDDNINNTTMLTTSGTASLTLAQSYIASGTASAISIGAGSTAGVASSTVVSSNTNAITGAGTLNLASIAFGGSSSTINTTTQVRFITRPSFSTKNQVFTSNGTYTPTAGMVYCSVEVLGGGGAGGGAPATGVGQFSGGGGGGAGEYARGIFTAATVGASQTVTIGAAGAGASGAVGGNGGTTSLGALITAGGGGGGTAGAAGTSVNAPGGANGTGGSGGDFRCNGATGFGCIGSVAATLVLSGQGANSQYGAGGQAVQGASNGQVASGHGAGGGGAFQGINAAALTGGNGTAGQIIIQEYVLS